MFSAVFLPIAVRGAASSIPNSRAARAPRAFTATSSPGAIAPPMNSPAAETASKLMAVPKSTTTSGPGRSASAATQFATRSDPTSWGLSTISGNPVRTPGPTIRASWPRCARAISASATAICGTPDEATVAEMSANERPRIASRPDSSTASSSAVRERTLVVRQWSRSSSPS